MENVEIDVTKKLNPWFSIWLKPRGTMRQILATEYPVYVVFILAAIGGISQSLDTAAIHGLGDKVSVPTIFGIALTLGAIGGIIQMYLGSFVLKWTGSWLKGQATYTQVRLAYVWTSIPLAWLLLFWIPNVLLFGEENFTALTPRIDESGSLLLMFLGLGIVEMIGGAWAFIIFLKCLGEVQGFSAWKALLNVLLAILVVIVPLVLIIFAVKMASA
jgi:hypothetical protein